MSALRTGSRLAHNGVNYSLLQYRNIATVYDPKIYTDSKATDATGAYTFTLPAGYFTALHYTDVTCVRDTNNPAFGTFAMVRSFTTTSVVVQCFESKNTGVLLGGNIEGLEVATSALTVQLFAIGV